jgi:hypothetical protein
MNSDVEFIAVDMTSANRLTIHNVAEILRAFRSFLKENGMMAYLTMMTTSAAAAIHGTRDAEAIPTKKRRSMVSGASLQHRRQRPPAPQRVNTQS